MKFAATAGMIDGDLTESLDGLLDNLSEQLAGHRPDLIVVFFSCHFEDEAPALVERIGRRFPATSLMGCSAESIIGPAAEYEHAPAVALLAGHLPGATIRPFRFDGDRLRDPQSVDEALNTLNVTAQDEPTFVLMGDPFSVPIDHILDRMNGLFPGRPVMGGMISGCERPEQAVIIHEGRIYRDGMVGLTLADGVTVDTIVSQGCRPVGEPFVITKCHQNVVLELGGKPALKCLQDVITGLSPEETQLARQALFAGRAVSEYKDQFRRGDFIIRHLMAVDPSTQGIAIADEMKLGRTLQFHIRDHKCADEDLRQLLDRQSARPAPAGALLFSCNGRGTRMWPKPNHDVSVLEETLGPVPVAGFFAAGELGPIGGQNFIHGHTASIALFRDAVSDDD